MFKVDKQINIPLYRQLMNDIIQQIDEGRLLKSQRLPSERQLAKEVGVNRSTVVRAYEELHAQGFVERKSNSGTYVLEGGIESFGVSSLPSNMFALSKGNPKKETYLAIVNQLITSGSPSVIDTYTGEIPLSLIPNIDLPNLKWQEFLEERNDSLGYLPLREVLKELVEEMYQYQGSVENIMLTAGGQQSLFLLLQTLLKPGDSVAIETPSFFNGLSLLTSMAIKVIEIPVDQDGMQVEILEEFMKKETIQLVLTNPNFQNPTGSSMSSDRRKKLIGLCHLYRTPIIEDDVFGQLPYQTTKRVPLLKELAPEQVIYIGSVSKVLGKEIQLGWIEAQKPVLDRVLQLRDELESQLSIFPQVLATHALKNQAFNNELKELRETLEFKKNELITEIQKQLKGTISYIMPKGGYYIWLTFNGRKLVEKDWERLLEQEVTVFPSFLIAKDSQSCRVNMARLPFEKIEEFVERLKKVTLIWGN